jgi:hypothetical protein
LANLANIPKMPKIPVPTGRPHVGHREAHSWPGTYRFPAARSFRRISPSQARRAYLTPVKQRKPPPGPRAQLSPATRLRGTGALLDSCQAKPFLRAEEAGLFLDRSAREGVLLDNCQVRPFLRGDEAGRADHLRGWGEARKRRFLVGPYLTIVKQDLPSSLRRRVGRIICATDARRATIVGAPFGPRGGGHSFPAARSLRRISRS